MGAAQSLSNFNNEGVDYLLIAGYAGMVHAPPRATRDRDILIRCDAENARAVWRHSPNLAHLWAT